MSSCEEYKHPQTWQPPVVSKRISAQNAQFFYSSVCDQETGSLWFEKEQEAYIGIALSSETKKNLLEQLEGAFDIRHLTLFPDIEGFGHANNFLCDHDSNHRW